MFNVELVTDDVEKAVAKVHLDQSGKKCHSNEYIKLSFHKCIIILINNLFMFKSIIQYLDLFPYTNSYFEIFIF